MIADGHAHSTRLPGPRHPFVEQALEFYSRTGFDYDDWSDGLHRKVAERLAELMEPSAGEHALDVGCGTGLVTRRIGAAVALGGRAVGVDVSDPMLDVARGRSHGLATYLHMDAGELTFPDAAFDIVTFGQSLPFLPDPEAALAQAHRVLRPGGRVGLCCQRRSLATEAQTAFFACLQRLARRHPMRVPRPPEDRAVFGEPRILLSLLREAGFIEVQQVQTVVGGKAATAGAWAEVMAGAGPYPHALISVLGPRARARFEMEVESVMLELGEEAYRLHHAFTFALARKEGPPVRREASSP